MTQVLDAFVPGAGRNRPTTPPSIGTAVAIVAVASGLLILVRFGGLAGQEPRAFLRATIVPIWGWIAMSAMIWLLATPMGDDPRPVLAAVGRAHLPLLALGPVLFVSAGAFDLPWVGLLATIGVFTWWFPASLVVGVAAAASAPIGRTMLAVGLGYAGWLVTVGRHLHGQVGHLL